MRSGCRRQTVTILLALACITVILYNQNRRGLTIERHYGRRPLDLEYNIKSLLLPKITEQNYKANRNHGKATQSPVSEKRETKTRRIGKKTGKIKNSGSNENRNKETWLDTDSHHSSGKQKNVSTSMSTKRCTSKVGLVAEYCNMPENMKLGSEGKVT